MKKSDRPHGHTSRKYATAGFLSPGPIQNVMQYFTQFFFFVQGEHFSVVRQFGNKNVYKNFIKSKQHKYTTYSDFEIEFN